MNWRQWFALLFFFILYLLLGGVVFMFFESPEEEIRSRELSNLRNVIYGLYFLFFCQNRHTSLITIDIRRHSFRSTDKLIMCETNVTNEIDLVGREEVWIQIAEQINQPTLINNRLVPPKKWTLYNSFFVAVTVASTIGTVCSIFIVIF